MFSVTQNAVREALTDHAPVREFASSRIATPDAESLAGAFALRRFRRMSGQQVGNFGERPNTVPQEAGNARRPDTEESSTPSADVGVGSASRRDLSRKRESSGASDRHADVLPALRVLGQAQRTYIVAEDAQGVFLIDQHAAHERVKYEEILAAKASEGELGSQPLLKQQVVQLSAQQQVAYSECSEWLAQTGWDVSPFGGADVIVRAVPLALAANVADSAESAESALKQLLDEVDDDSTKSGRASKLPFVERMLATVACHSAVRAGDVLTQSECEEIVRQLAECESPQSCPHGRPTMLMLSGEALEREFGRRG